MVEETIVPQIYTPLEENEMPQNPSNTMQDMQESGVSVAVNQETIKSGEEVTTVSVVASSLGKEKSMSPPVLEEEFEMNELGHDGEEAPVIEVEEEPNASKSKAVIDVEIEEVAVSPSKKGRGKGKKQDEEKEPAEKKRRGRSAANAGIEKEETSSKRRTRGSKMDVTEEEEEKVETVEAEEVSDEEEDLVVNKATPKQYGKGRGRAKKEQDEDDIVISTPDTGKKGRGRSKKEQKEEGEEVKIETPKKGRGRRKKEEIIQEIDDDDENDEKVVETPKKGRGKSKKEEIKQDDDQEADIEEVTPVKGKRGKPSKSDTSGKVTRKALKDEEERQGKSPRGRRGRSKKAAEPEVEIETVEQEEYEIMKNEDDEEEIKPDEADINKEEDEFIKEDEDDEEDTPLASLKRGRISDEMDPEPSTSGTVKKMKLESEEVYEHVIEDDGLDETKEELEEVMEDEFDETKEEEEEIEDEEEEEIMDDEEEQQEVLIYRNRTSLSQHGEILIAQPMPKPVGDPYSFDQMEENTPKPIIESKVENANTPLMKTFSTQTPIDPPDANDFVEVVTFADVPGKRTVMTQTDPKLRRKKFGPIGAEGELDYDVDDYSRKRRKREDELGLFEDMENRRRSFKRNAEEALKCPFCDKGFIGMWMKNCHFCLRAGPVAWSDARPPGIQMVAGSILGFSNICLWRLVMKSFLRPFSPYR